MQYTRRDAWWWTSRLSLIILASIFLFSHHWYARNLRTISLFHRIRCHSALSWLLFLYTLHGGIHCLNPWFAIIISIVQLCGLKQRILILILALLNSLDFFHLQSLHLWFISVVLLRSSFRLNIATRLLLSKTFLRNIIPPTSRFQILNNNLLYKMWLFDIYN